MLNHQVQVKNFDPVVFVGDLPYSEVRSQQLQGEGRNIFSMPFLYCLQNKLIERLYEQVRGTNDPHKTEKMLDTFVMLMMLMSKAEYGKLSGIDEETLVDVVGQSTQMVEW